MPTAILVTGFNNWGKSTLIQELFQRHRFSFGVTYTINNINSNFLVESRSNDDLSEANYVNTLQQRINQAPSRHYNLLCAFCPTREPNNDSLRILNHNVFSPFNNIYLFFLVFKWDHHAKLIVPNLQTYYQNTSANVIAIDTDATIQGDTQRLAARTQQVVRELQRIFP